MENASEGTHSNKNSLSISGEESAGLSVCPATHFKMFRQKRSTHKLLRSNHPYYRNVAKHLWREPQIIKIENSFHIWIDIGCICERTLSATSRVKSRFRACLTDCNLHYQLHCAVTHFEQNFSKLVPDSIRYFIIVE